MNTLSINSAQVRRAPRELAGPVGADVGNASALFTRATTGPGRIVGGWPCWDLVDQRHARCVFELEPGEARDVVVELIDGIRSSF